MKYDYLIIGSGFFGSVCARELTDDGKKCLVIDKKKHIGGNCYTENIEGINVHKYGPHIFHTSNEVVWNYINKYAKFNNFVYRPKVSYKNELYSFPINLFTLYQKFGVKTPIEAHNFIENVKIKINNPKNFEEYALSLLGHELYNTFIYGYTKKQWNKDPKELPSSILKRIPFRLTFDDNYFNDAYQGIPIGGYTKIFEKLLDGIEVKLNVNYFDDRNYWDNISNKIIYTGPVDEFFNYSHGKLEYINMKFENEYLNIEDYQGNAAINYTDESIPYTRIIEHKHFEKSKTSHTIITREYSNGINHDTDKYYPISTDNNLKLYQKYKNLTLNTKNVIFGGRLAEYKYYDMHHVIENALNTINYEKIKFKRCDSSNS